MLILCKICWLCEWCYLFCANICVILKTKHYSHHLIAERSRMSEQITFWSNWNTCSHWWWVLVHASPYGIPQRQMLIQQHQSEWPASPKAHTDIQYVGNNVELSNLLSVSCGETCRHSQPRVSRSFMSSLLESAVAHVLWPVASGWRGIWGKAILIVTNCPVDSVTYISECWYATY